MNGFEKRQCRIDSLTTQAIYTKSKIKRAFLVGMLRQAQAEMKLFMRTHTVSAILKTK